MSVWKKLFTAVKGGANEAAEAIVDTQALRILDQEIREAKEELRKSDEALTKIMAKRKLSESKLSSLKSSIADYEKYALDANSKGDTQLALDCAQKVADLRAEEQSEQSFKDQFVQSEQTLKANIAKAKTNLKKLQQQVDIVKATESVQKAQASISAKASGANSKMKTASESLARIQQKQQERQAQFEAAAELAEDESGDSLEKRLQEAGISGTNSSASEELERILGKS